MNREIETYLTAGTMIAGLKAITGRTPIAATNPDGTIVIRWKDEDRAAVGESLEKLFVKVTEPGAVKLEIMPVILPYLLKAGIPIFLAILILGYFMGVSKADE